MYAVDKARALARAAMQAGGPMPADPRPLTTSPQSRSGRGSAALATRVGLAARVAGALSLLAVGAVHLQQYLELYSEIPTIGTLFVLNFIGATVLGLGLLAPLERLLGRAGRVLLVLVALGGTALAATSFIFLWISERTPLFGFMEPGYDPEAILASRVAEVATVVFLGGFLATRAISRRLRPGPRRGARTPAGSGGAWVGVRDR
jgi:hypothetical protein